MVKVVQALAGAAIVSTAAATVNKFGPEVANFTHEIGTQIVTAAYSATEAAKGLPRKLANAIPENAGNGLTAVTTLGLAIGLSGGIPGVGNGNSGDS